MSKETETIEILRATYAVTFSTPRTHISVCKFQFVLSIN